MVYHLLRSDKSFGCAYAAVQEVHRQITCAYEGSARAVQVRLHDSSGRNSRKFRCTKRNSSSQKHARSFYFLSDFFYHGQNFTLYQAEVHLEQEGSSIVTNKKVTSWRILI
jgi:hypothetical protein